MKFSPGGIISAIASDLAGFVLLAGLALLMGITANHFRHEPLPLLPPSPSSLSGSFPPTSPEISLAKLQDLSGRRATRIIDARPAPFFVEGHIPGAINLPLDDLKNPPANVSPSLPFSQNESLVVYCADVSCPAAKSVARILKTRGFRDITIFPGGWYAWKKAGLPIETTP